MNHPPLLTCNYGRDNFHSTGPLLPREQFTKSSNGRAAKQRLAEVSGEPAGAPPQARPGGRQSLRTTGAIGNERRPMVLGPSGRVVAMSDKLLGNGKRRYFPITAEKRGLWKLRQVPVETGQFLHFIIAVR